MQMGPEESQADRGNCGTNANYRDSQAGSALGLHTRKSPVASARSSNSFLLQLIRETCRFLEEPQGWFILLKSCFEVFQAVSLQKERGVHLFPG